MSARALALAAACAAAFAATAVAQGPPLGPGGGLPQMPGGPKPPGGGFPPLPSPCANGQRPTPQKPCSPTAMLPGGESFMPPGAEEGEPGEMPPIPCGDEQPEFPGELPGGEPELRVTGESEEPPFPGCMPFELDAPEFMPGFLKRSWRFEAEANGFADGMLDVTITRFPGLPRKFRDQDDALVDEFAFVLVGARARVIDDDGDRVIGNARDKALDDAVEVKATGKLLAPGKWKADEDDELVPTIRAKRVVIED